jgi:hypothetical protein
MTTRCTSADVPQLAPRSFHDLDPNGRAPPAAPTAPPAASDLSRRGGPAFKSPRP